MFGYLGPNGAGKTTSLRMMLGLIRPDRRRCRTVRTRSAVDGARALEGVAGFVEAPRFYPYLSGRRNLRAPRRTRRRRRPPADRRRARPRRAARPRQGQGRRLLAGHAAAARHRRVAPPRPRALLLDEPTNGLDPAGIRDMREMIKQLAATGSPSCCRATCSAEVEELCKRVAIIRNGRIVYEGALSEFHARHRGLPAAYYRQPARATRPPGPPGLRTSGSTATGSSSPPTRAAVALSRRARRGGSRLAVARPRATTLEGCSSS